MKVIYGIDKIQKFKNPVVALGVFDGVHRGHQLILKKAVAIAKKINGTPMVFTFSPHPQRIESICSLEHRISLIAQIGMEVAAIANFNRSFARISGGDFVKKILWERMGARFICVGKNFRFGRNASGDIRLLNELSHCYGFEVKVYKAMKIKGRIISSTFIRALIKKGDFAGARQMLGRRVSILGSVIHGRSLAKKIGFPTANINPHHEVVPPSGVYAAEVIFTGKKFFGVCSIGNKPTLEGGKKQHIEVHIFGFSHNIYGKQLEVIFIKKIRPQKIFASISELARQIEKDITFAKTLFFPPLKSTTISRD